MPHTVIPSPALLEAATVASTADITLKDGEQFLLCSGDETLELTEGDFEPGIIYVEDFDETTDASTNTLPVVLSNVARKWGFIPDFPIKRLNLAQVTVRIYKNNGIETGHFHYYTGMIVTPWSDEQFVKFTVIPEPVALGVRFGTATLSPARGYDFPPGRQQAPGGAQNRGAHGLRILYKDPPDPIITA